jgi:hypothetical protein
MCNQLVDVSIAHSSSVNKRERIMKAQPYRPFQRKLASTSRNHVYRKMGMLLVIIAPPPNATSLGLATTAKPASMKQEFSSEVYSGMSSYA